MSYLERNYKCVMCGKVVQPNLFSGDDNSKAAMYVACFSDSHDPNFSVLIPGINDEPAPMTMGGVESVRFERLHASE